MSCTSASIPPRFPEMEKKERTRDWKAGERTGVLDAASGGECHADAVRTSDSELELFVLHPGGIDHTCYLQPLDGGSREGLHVVPCLGGEGDRKKQGRVPGGMGSNTLEQY